MTTFSWSHATYGLYGCTRQGKNSSIYYISSKTKIAKYYDFAQLRVEKVSHKLFCFKCFNQASLGCARPELLKNPSNDQVRSKPPNDQLIYFIDNRDLQTSFIGKEYDPFHFKLIRERHFYC